MGSKITLFSTSAGYIVGRIINETEKTFNLKSPGIVQTVQDKKNPRIPKIVITEFIPPIAKNRKKLMRNFPLPKNLVLFYDECTPEFIVQYQNYENQILKKETGIEVVGKEALNNIKSNKILRGVFNGKR